MLDDMQQLGIIEELKSTWSSPVVLVSKNNRDLLSCVDYRKMSDVTRSDCFPLTCIGDALDKLAGAKWFSTLYLKSGYWQLALYPYDNDKTAFPKGQGLWQFTVMPFGLCNTPATFERLIIPLRGLTSLASCTWTMF
jgi:hypothetical protein